MRFDANTISPAGTAKCSAATSVMRALICSAALSAAMPLRSEPEEAAVGEVFGTFAVLVADTRIWSRSIANVSATTCATLTNRPCPISVPPWLSTTLPSV